MSKNGTSKIDSLLFLQIMTGVFFIIAGLEALIHYNSAGGQLTMGISKIFGKSDYIIQIIIAVLEVLSGIVVIAAILVPVKETMLQLAILIIFIIWAARIVYVYFVARQIFDPSVLVWLKDISLDGIVLMALWILRGRV